MVMMVVKNGDWRRRLMWVTSDDERGVHGCRWWLWWTSEVGSTGKTMEKNGRWISTPFKHPATIDTATIDSVQTSGDD
ncbi:hypothetical protein HanXRQr2_Chr09g0409211 [Helianthus annuus]|uniref:Uncharacterized protein n=1 Tax=Helianthus annuus TaxID=4232 RepID=A0A9K3NAA2_HELAN|nr:hypothetical protein HanXRQr2_Chr09g0409211 [Helianthus annuus]